MLVAILSGYLFGLLAPAGVRAVRGGAGPFVAVLPAFLFAYFLQFVPDAAEGRPWRFAFAWGGPGGLDAAFWLDALALYYALLITGLASVAALATAGLALSDQARGRLLLGLMFLMSSSLGFVLAQTPALMMSFSVLASLSVFLLLTAQRGAAERAARIPVLIALLMGDLLLVAALAGLFPGGEGAAASELLNRAMSREPLAIASGVLLVAAGFTRFILIPAELRARRQGPMSTPAALLAYGAGYVPLTLYVVLRFAPILGGAPQFQFLLGLLGGALLIVGGITGIRAQGLRTLLAGVSALMMGMAFIQLATFNGQGTGVAMLFVLTHALGLGVLLLAAQLASGGPGSIELSALRGAMRGNWVALALLILGVLAFAGLVPSTGLLLLSKSLEAGLGSVPNPAEIAFMTIGHALLIAALLKIIRSLMIVSDGRPLPPSSRGISTAIAAFVLLSGLVGLGWKPATLEHLFIDPVIYRMAAITPIGPFWPRGLAIALAAAALVTAGLLLWFGANIAGALDWMGGALPRRPDRIWGKSLALAGKLAALGSRAAQRFGYARSPAAVALMLCGVFVWLGIVALGRLPAWPVIVWLPMGALAAIAALTALLSLAQKNCESALPLVSICGVVTALVVLSSGIVELAYLMVLIVVLETAMLLVLEPRIMAAEAEQARDGRLSQAARIALALIAGAGAALASILVPSDASPAGWTSLDQFQLWSAIVVMLLVLGVIITELNRQRMRSAP